jgi:hypothetical protein
MFPAPLTGACQRPRAFSNEGARVAASIGFAGITFHALQRTQVSQLHDAGVDVVTISKRLGHRSAMSRSGSMTICSRASTAGGGRHQRPWRGSVARDTRPGGNRVAAFA